ncbi:MAG TPA: DUF3108 domain-containing protein [Bryobacteraceae bacterium]|nr:DUF3108 domain-containing protein [Bryobacteraceae bacterium]
MKVACALAFVSQLALAAPLSTPAPTGFPFTDEDLNYNVTWPSGISLGEAHMHAKHSSSNWNFELTLNAGVPGYAVKDTYASQAVGDLCSSSFDRTTSHGSRTAKEHETIDRDRGTATRTTVAKDAGKSDFPVPACVKDALTYIFYARREMGQGKVPAAQQVLFGGLYNIRSDYGGAATITQNEKPIQTDKLTCTIKAGTSEYKVDIYFARDAARTPLRISAPLAMGKFSMELIR